MRATALDRVRRELRVSPREPDESSAPRTRPTTETLALLTECAAVAPDRSVAPQRTNVTAIASNCVGETEPTNTSALIVEASIICTSSKPYGGKPASNGLYSLYATSPDAMVTVSGRGAVASIAQTPACATVPPMEMRTCDGSK